MSSPTSQRLRIVSDGTAKGTVVYDAAGDVVKWGAAFIEKIEILPIEPGGVVKAMLTLGSIGLDIDADAVVVIC